MCDLDLERKDLEANQERILDRLDSQDMVLEQIVEQLKTLNGKVKNEDRLLDNQDVCEMLKVSKRTLQRYRSDEGLRYEMVLHKTLYRESDVKNFVLEQFNKRAQKQENDEDEL